MSKISKIIDEGNREKVICTVLCSIFVFVIWLSLMLCVKVSGDLDLQLAKAKAVSRDLQYDSDAGQAQ